MARIIVDIKFRGDDTTENPDQFSAVFKAVQKALTDAKKSGEYDEVLSNWELSAMSPKRFDRAWTKEVDARKKYQKSSSVIK